MARQILDLTPALLNGLPRYPSDLNAEEHLEFVNNFIVRDKGLVGASVGNFMTDPDPDYPNSQVFVCERGIIRLGDTSLGVLNPSGWSESTPDLYPTSQLTPVGGPVIPDGTITSGQKWHFGSMSNSWFATNGASLVFYNPHEDVLAHFVTSSYVPNTLCTHKGRLWLGGVASLMDDGDFKDAVDAERTILSSLDQIDLQDNYIYVCEPELRDFEAMMWPWKLFEVNGGSFRDVYMGNEYAWLSMRGYGDVLAMLPLGDGVVVYCEHNICYVEIAKDQFALVRTELANYGPISRDIVCGSTKKHVFVDENYGLRVIAADLSISDAMYIGELASLDSSSSAVYEPVQDLAFISDGSFTYVLSKHGFSRIDVAIYVAFAYNNTINMLTVGSQGYSRLITGILDFGTKELSTVFGFQVDTDEPDNYEARLYYRDDLSSSFSVTSFVPLELSGYVEFILSAVEFQLELRNTSTKTSTINHLQVIYDNEGKLGLSGRF